MLKVNFKTLDGDAEGIYVLYDPGRDTHLIFIPKYLKKKTIGWIMRKSQMPDLFEKVKAALPDFEESDILDGEFYHVKKYTILDDKNYKEVDMTKVNAKDEVMTTQDNQSKNELWDYAKDVMSEGARLAMAGKLIQKTKDIIIQILVQDALGSKIEDAKSEEMRANLADAQRWAKTFMDGTMGTCFIGMILGALIKGGGMIGGEYTELLRHPEVQKFAKAVHVRTVMEGGDFFLNQIEAIIRPMIAEISGVSKNLRVFAEELNSAKDTTSHELKAHEEEKAIQEAKETEKVAKKTMNA